MKVFIIEDEIPARINLERALRFNFEDIEIVGYSDSIAGSVRWLGDRNNKADIVFMDVELADGQCFEIFKKVRELPKVIMTTAYDNYAIKAFKVNSVDYLLKPVDYTELVNAVNKCRRPSAEEPAPDILRVEQELLRPRNYKNRFAVKRGTRIIIVSVKDIAYLSSEDKTTWLATRDGARYIIDQSLDQLSSLLDPREFFRPTRACIVSIDSIRSVAKHLNGRLKIILEPSPDGEIFVSRQRIPNFMRWLNGEEF